MRINFVYKLKSQKGEEEKNMLNAISNYHEIVHILRARVPAKDSLYVPELGRKVDVMLVGQSLYIADDTGHDRRWHPVAPKIENFRPAPMAPPAQGFSSAYANASQKTSSVPPPLTYSPGVHWAPPQPPHRLDDTVEGMQDFSPNDETFSAAIVRSAPERVKRNSEEMRDNVVSE
ncbi:MAG: hypothetical protein EOO38_11835, partial [Cytophagaceae bacterium]